MGNNEKNPIESGLDELKDIIAKLEERSGKDVEALKENLEAVKEKLEDGIEKAKKNAPEPPKEFKETVKTNIETMTAAYAAGMMPTTPGEGPAVGIEEEGASVPKFVEDIAAAPERIEEETEKIKETIEDAVKTNIETMDEAYAAGMTPTAPGEAPAVGIPEDEISEDEKIDIPTPKELFEISAETMTESAEVGMNPLEADPGIVLPKDE